MAGQGGRRLVRTLGWQGVLMVAFAVVIALTVLVEGRRDLGPGLLRPLVIAVLGLVVIAWHWGSYQASVRTEPYQRILQPLLASTEEFCLLLRPFGSDGETLVTVRPRRGLGSGIAPSLTLEQVVCRAVRNTLRQRTLAIVDQQLTLAPPGPEYLRASDDAWQPVALALIQRAHTIAIVLHAGQDVRGALGWELDRIVETRRQSRVLLVLPDPARPGDAEALRTLAARVIATLQRSRVTAPVAVDDLDRALALLPARTCVIRLRRSGPGHRTQTWHVPPPRRGRAGATASRSAWLWRRRPVAAFGYLDAISEALLENETRWAGQRFDDRYPPDGAAGAPTRSPGPGSSTDRPAPADHPGTTRPATPAHPAHG